MHRRSKSSVRSLGLAALMALGAGAGPCLAVSDAPVAPGAGAASTGAEAAINSPPTPADWQALAKLADFSGVWTPDLSDQVSKERGPGAPPWTPAAAKRIAKMFADEEAGRPFPIIDHCFPTGMPSYMLITHNAFEILVTPGRVTLLGEGDGNRLRRIYTDGRPHPPDPDPSFHGHSIGHWEGKTLVVDTVALLPEVYLAVSEAVGIPNNGEMHIVERLHVGAADTLYDDLEITDSKLLTKTWKTTRKYYRQRAKKYDIVEGVCEQGNYMEAIDEAGNAVFEPLKYHVGVLSGSESK